MLKHKRNFNSTSKLHMDVPTAIAAASTLAPAPFLRSTPGVILCLVTSLSATIFAFKAKYVLNYIDLNPADLGLMIEQSKRIIEGLDALYNKLLEIDIYRINELYEQVAHESHAHVPLWHKVLPNIIDIHDAELELSNVLRSYRYQHSDALTVSEMWKESYDKSEKVINLLRSLLNLEGVSQEKLSEIIDSVERLNNEIHILDKLLQDN